MYSHNLIIVLDESLVYSYLPEYAYSTIG